MNKNPVKNKEDIKIVHNAKHGSKYLLISFLSMTEAGVHRNMIFRKRRNGGMICSCEQIPVYV
jgi:hypothetical protein